MFKRSFLTLTLAALLNACGGGAGSDAASTLSLGIVDAPVDGAQHVYVQFHGLELHGPDGTVAISFATPKQLDLLALTGSNDAPLLSDYALTAGDYQWMRLMVDTSAALDSYIVTADGTTQELSIPSGAETGLKLNQGFTLAQGGHADFTIDFDLRRSLVQDAGGFKLKPVLRLVNNLQVGTLSGSVDASLIAAHCGANEHGAVYVFEGAVMPDDVDGVGAEPISSAQVASDGSGAYTVGFLAAGSYTAAWTCDADADDPLTDDLHSPAQGGDTVGFGASAAVTITANATTTQNFGP